MQHEADETTPIFRTDYWEPSPATPQAALRTRSRSSTTMRRARYIRRSGALTGTSELYEDDADRLGDVSQRHQGTFAPARARMAPRSGRARQGRSDVRECAIGQSKYGAGSSRCASWKRASRSSASAGSLA
jgi:hypothetical protein